MRCSAFFSPGLHPVLNRGVWHKNAVVPPKMPTGRAVGQSVFHHQTHRHRNDTVGVVALGQSQVQHVHVEVALALTAIMLRVRNTKITRPLPHQVAEVVQRPLESAIAAATSTALRARPPRIAATAPHPQGFRQVLDTSDSLRTIGSVFSRSRHGHPPWCNWSRENTAKRSARQQQYPVMMLQTRNLWVIRNKEEPQGGRLILADLR